MPRRQRNDEPHSLHHVFNRAIARRTMFETRKDVRFFIAQLARSVRRGEIRVLAYSVLTTHYHLFVESSGVLADAMCRIQTAYSRYFNRTRRRDGALARGRFASKRVDSYRYRMALVNYIDQNPVQARLVKSAIDYEFGSAHDYARRSGPVWLSREWVTEVVADMIGRRPGDAGAYRQVFGGEHPEFSEVIERRMDFADKSDDPLDDLIDAAPRRVMEWMKKKAHLADGTRPGLPVVPRSRVMEQLRRREDSVLQVADSSGHRGSTVFHGMTCGLLRGLCGLRHREIASEGISEGSIGRHLEFNRLSLLSNEEYSRLIGEIAHGALAELPDLVNR